MKISPLAVMAATFFVHGCASAQTEPVTFRVDDETQELIADGREADPVIVGALEHRVDELCWYSNGEAHMVFLTDGDGGIRQYATDLERLLYVRTIHANPDTEICRVSDDGREIWYLDEATGIWRTDTNAESEPVAEPVAMFAPWGELADGVETIDPALMRRTPGRRRPRAAAVVPASRETDPVRLSGDVADDPAILVHPTDPARSLVLGSDKAEGLRVYDLLGRELQFLPVGRLNNVDVSVVESNGRRRAIAAASNRTYRRLDLFEIDLATGRAAAAGSWPVTLDDPYGVCVSKSGPLEVFIGGTEGRIQRWTIDTGDDRISASLSGEYKFESQTEGCYVDAEDGTLYVGEEDVGVWRLPLAEPDRRELLIAVSDPALVADIEGLVMIEGRDGRRRLVLSSQGDDSVLVYDLESRAVELKFRIGMNLAAGVDGASETDGLDVTTAALPGFPSGMLVVQDGRNVAPPAPQNFKFVDWEAVEALVR